MIFNPNTPTPIQETEFRIAKQLRKALQLDCENKMEWISVKYRLPEQDEPVWIWWRSRELVIGWKTHQNGEPSENWYSYHGGDKERWATHWMPIDLKQRPQPPKKEEI